MYMGFRGFRATLRYKLVLLANIMSVFSGSYSCYGNRYCYKNDNMFNNDWAVFGYHE